MKGVLEKCDTEKIVIDGTKWGSDWNAITIYRHTPKGFDTSKKGYAYIYVHGSGFAYYNADMC